MPYKLDIKGWMGEDELQVIEQLAKTASPVGVIVEVGSFCGKSAWAWSMSTDPSVTVYCFDPFYEDILDHEGNKCNTWQEFQKNTAECKNIITIRGMTPEHAGYTDPRPIDVFFVDASHHNPSDWDIIQHFLPFVKSGGIVAGHDYTKYFSGFPVQFPDVNQNVHRLEELFDQKAKVTSTFWYFVKP